MRIRWRLGLWGRSFWRCWVLRLVYRETSGLYTYSVLIMLVGSHNGVLGLCITVGLDIYFSAIRLLIYTTP